MANLNDPGLFGTTTRTSTLLVIGMLEESHAGEIARILGRSPSRIKAAVDGLERLGVIVGTDVGTARRLRLNPRFVAAVELKALLHALALHDVPLQQRLAGTRRRPRRSGKEL